MDRNLNSSGSIGNFLVFGLNDSNPKIRVWKARNAHVKANTGCIACKAKRVKCDESKPVCKRCRRNERSCAYRSKIGQASDRSHTLSPLSAVTVTPFSAPSAPNGTPTMYLLNHVQTHWTDIFHMHHREHVIELFASSEIVRNTLLALAASHLRHVAPNMIHHRVAEHYQQNLALRDYQIALKTHPRQLGQDGANAIMLSALLLNVLAFAFPELGSEHNSPKSWVLSGSDKDLGWLAMQAGLQPLMDAMAPYMEGVLRFLAPLFLANKETWALPSTPISREEIPERWRQAFKLEDDGTNTPNEIFRSPLTLIFLLRNGHFNNNNSSSIAFKHLQFLGKMDPAFRLLLYQRDERALWVFGYWLGLMCRRKDQIWWCERRARRDYMAIGECLMNGELRKGGGGEAKVWRGMMDEYGEVLGGSMFCSVTSTS